MSNINEVRERLHAAANLYERGQNFAHCNAADVTALLADHARLKARVAEMEARPSVDLEQFRPSVLNHFNAALLRKIEAQQAASLHEARQFAEEAAECRRLLALIDGSKAGEVKP